MKLSIDAEYQANAGKFRVVIGQSDDGKFNGYRSEAIFDSHWEALRGGVRYLELNEGFRFNWNVVASLTT